MHTAGTHTAVKRSLEMRRSLDLAHRYISGALRFDYLSNGLGHHRSAAPTRPAARVAGRVAGATTGRDIVRQYLAEVAKRRRLSSSEEYCLVSAALRGNTSARQQLIEHHLGLVTMLARRYRNRGLPLLDLIAEGNIGLILALRKFDPERGFRFSTYAKWWIRQSIELALMTQTRIVRVPVHVTRKLQRAPQSIHTHRRRFLLYDVRNQTSLPLEDAGSEPGTLIAQVPAPEQEQPEWPAHLATRRRELEKAMQLLKDSERKVLQGRFGLEDDATRTLLSIARELQVSSERVRQIQAEALAKLRQILQRESGPGRDNLL
jgi:RNA polymerase nonessential primary-like sigma factor